MSQSGQTEKSDRPPSRSVLPPEPDIDAKQPAVACGARPFDGIQSEPWQGQRTVAPVPLKLGPIEVCAFWAALFLFRLKLQRADNGHRSVGRTGNVSV